MSPDELCEAFSETGRTILIRDLDEDTVLIEGQPDALEFLGKLLIAQAHLTSDDGFSIGPDGPGYGLFSPGSTKGIYIHVLLAKG